jgi:hypothetical protein
VAIRQVDNLYFRQLIELLNGKYNLVHRFVTPSSIAAPVAQSMQI